MLFYSMKRKTDVHVGYDDNRWQYAADMVLDIEGAVTQFLSYSLFDDASPSTIASSQKAQDKSLVANLKQSGLLSCARKGMSALLSWINECTSVAIQDVELHFHDSQLDVTRPLSFACPKFSVLTDSVSVHISLHRFMSKLVLFASYGNVDMQALLGFLREHYSPVQLIHLLDYPLRALSFNATVSINMWVRNGQSAANLAYNYNRPPLTKSLRDLDIIAVQISLLTLDPSLVLLMMLKRLELTFLYPNSSPPGHNVVNEYRAGLIRCFLKILVHVFGYPPITLSKSGASEAVEGAERALARELFHSIFSGSSSSVDLERVKHMVGVIETISDQTFHNVLQNLCDKSPNEGGVKLALKEDSFVFFDPFFPNANSKQSEALLDRMRDRLTGKVDRDGRYRNPEKFVYNPYCPLLLVEHLPIPHKEFMNLKSLLFNPFLINILHTILAYALQSGTQQYIGSIAYILHIVHMQLYEIEQLHEKKYITGANQKLSSLLPVIRDLCVLWEKEVLKSDMLFQHALGFILVQLMYFTDYKGLLHRHGSMSEEDLETVRAAGFERALHSFLESLSIQVGEEAEGVERIHQSKPQAAGKLAAQKAMEEAQRKAQEMMQSFAGEMSDSDEEDEMETEDKEGSAMRVKKRQDHTCIICKLKSAQPLGYLCFLQPTNTHKHMVLSVAKGVYPDSLYRVVALKGCDVHAAPKPDSKVLQHISHNELVHVVKLFGKWAQIASPVEGFVTVYHSNSAPNVVNEQNLALTRFCSEVTTVLYPVKEMWFNKHGGSRMHGIVISKVIFFM
ncbi:hypothetical protein EON65_20580 [archaeon]|nr:MAG: hypothetical protein EON65_20580 [archaeon]